MMADIERMFHQEWVKHDDMDFLCFLWWPDSDTSKGLEEYQITIQYEKQVTDTVKSNFYVDDCL